MMRLFLLIALFLGLFDARAVLFTSQSSDDALLEFGKKMPFVCGISQGKEPLHGSGCLVDVDDLALVGRVVATAAHNFNSDDAPEGVPPIYLFHFGAQQVPGELFIHPNYNQDTGHADVAFVLLRDKIDIGASCPKLGGDINFQKFFEQPLIIAGVGCTGNCDTPFQIIPDEAVRAASVCAPPSLQCVDDKE